MKVVKVLLVDMIQYNDNAGLDNGGHICDMLCFKLKLVVLKGDVPFKIEHMSFPF